jgi:hypothetical protein
VAVLRDGELLPDVKQVLAIIAKHGLVIASGHILPEEASMVAIRLPLQPSPSSDTSAFSRIG